MKLYKGDCLEKFECANCGCYFMVEDRSNFECPNCEEDSFRLINDNCDIKLDETYFNIAKERIEKHTTQERLFTGEIK